MNKKIIIGIVVLVFIMGVTITLLVTNIKINNGDSKNDNQNTSSQIDKQEEKEQEKQEQEQEKDLYDNYLVAYRKDIYVSYRDRLRRKGLGLNAQGVGSNYDFVLFCYETEKEFKGTVEDVFDYFNSGDYYLINNIIFKGEASFTSSEKFKIIKEQQENVKVNELDMIKFKGKVVDRYKKEFKVYGYSFIIDNTPCMLIGFDFSNEAKDELIDDIEKEVDIMIKTVRTKR